MDEQQTPVQGDQGQDQGGTTMPTEQPGGMGGDTGAAGGDTGAADGAPTEGADNQDGQV